MPEYLAPGVYVTEIASGAKPIDGVSTSTTDLIGRTVVAELQRLSGRPAAPDWTDHNAHDPGVALLELFAWLTESLLYRTNQLPERGRLNAARLAAAALALTTNGKQPPGSVLRRARFFRGRCWTLTICAPSRTARARDPI